MRERVKERRADSREYEQQKDECTFKPKIGCRALLGSPRLHGMPKIPPPISNMLSFKSKIDLHQDKWNMEAMTSPKQNETKSSNLDFQFDDKNAIAYKSARPSYNPERLENTKPSPTNIFHLKHHKVITRRHSPKID